MSLETRIKAAFERVAATIKLRGVPAGGTAGQVLTKGGVADYDADWVTPAAGGGGGGLVTVSHDSTLSGDGTPGNPLSVIGGAGGSAGSVYLSTVGTPSFLPAQRLTHQHAGNWRTMGPILPGGTYTRMRVPLRNVIGGEVMAAALIRTADNVVLHRYETALTPGQTEWVIEGPWSVTGPTAFVVGSTQGSWETNADRWYGGEATYTDYPSQPLFRTDTVISAEGSVFSPSGPPVTDKQRTVLVEGKNTTKNTHNPLDPADFPAVAAVAEIPNGGGARLRDTNNFYIRRETGQLLEFIGTPVSG